MEIRTKHKIKTMKVGDLEMMRAYLIFDKGTNDNNLLIRHHDKVATVLSKANNCNDLVLTLMDKDCEVNVIGQIDDFDIVNVSFNNYWKELNN